MLLRGVWLGLADFGVVFVGCGWLDPASGNANINEYLVSNRTAALYKHA